MQTEAVFENIAERIQQEIGKAQKSIYVAVAWFTNRNLFNVLIRKAKEGCSISLIVAKDTINTTINFDQLLLYKSKVYKVGDVESELMHNKFCIIDYTTVITGSYNWSYKAESNFENVIITYDDTILAKQFISEFDSIRSKYLPEEVKEDIDFPIIKIIKRLEILQNYIVLEDIDELNKESKKLGKYDFNSDIQEIIDDVRNQEYAAAVNKIQKFINRNQQLLLWTDPEIAALKLEIKNLENQLNAYDNEKTELEKLLSDFQHRHAIELGEIILEILRFRKIKFKSDETKFKEADTDEKQYREQFETEKVREVYELTEEQKVELKKKFRKATVLCHPDKVSDNFKIQAQEVFIELKKAYDSNDLKKVKEILEELEKGNYFPIKSDTINEKDLLKTAINKLRKQIKKLKDEIIEIKQSETFITVSSIENWDDYFSQTKKRLIEELEALKLELA